jgi:hypothetical protein
MIHRIIQIYCRVWKELNVSTVGLDNRFGHEEEDNSWQWDIKEDKGTMSKGYCCLTVEENKEESQIVT